MVAILPHSAEDGVAAVIRALGENPDRDGLKDTPGRVVRALVEMTSGYREDPSVILSRTFAEKSDEMIVLRDIEFYSLCEHHLLPFHGTATVAYLCGKEGRVVGISKLARLVLCYARRLQIQERLTRQIAEAVQAHLRAEGCGVVITAHHLCMGCRGVRQPNARMVTSSLLGSFRSDPAVRAEFLQLTEGSK